MNDSKLFFSVTTARKLLGKKARKFSDKEIEQQIDLAEMLKNVFFASQMYKKIEVEKGGEK